ncbi:aromatic ring-opening dioxygenase LigA [[Kitasatospora] papulosa]|uniref:aromatic ring-opening dioxygenase LigA n=1 Tax=[Kitasatospora] papulosa TaxID=1464011 RepID=UPI0032469271
MRALDAPARLDRARRLLDTAPPAPLPGQLAVEVDETPPVCEHGNPRCGETPVRPYVQGPRCEAHQPANTRPYFQPPK